MTRAATTSTASVASIEQLVAELTAALVNSKIYWGDHPRVQRSIDAIQRLVLEITACSSRPDVALFTVEGFLVHDGQPVLGATITGARLLQALEAIGAGGVLLSNRATKSDIQSLLSALTTPRATASLAETNAELDGVGAHAVHLLPPSDKELGPAIATGDRGDPSRSLRIPIKLYQSVMDLLQTVTTDVCQGGTIRLEAVQSTAEDLLGHIVDDQEQVLSLARHDLYDAFTFGHSIRVAVLAMNFGRHVTGDRSALIRLGTAALLHDVGKALIPFEILHSRTVLSDEERAVMSGHAELGAQVLLDQPRVDPAAIAAAFGHHTSASARSYPKTLHEHRLGIATELVKICDVYEALTAARPYKRPMSPIRAYRIMIGMRDHFRADLLRRFIEVNGIYPAGQLVRLGTGELAEVVRQSARAVAPVVRVLRDADGARQDVGTEPLVDLSAPAPNGRAATQIVDVVDPLDPDSAPRHEPTITRTEVEAARGMAESGDGCVHPTDPGAARAERPDG